MKLKKLAILLIGIFLSFLIIGCSAQEAVYTNLSDAEDDAQVVIRGRTGDSTYQVPRVDSTTHTLQTIDYVHHEIHDGNHYYMEGFVTLNDAQTLYVKLVTPDTAKWAHFTWHIDSSGILETNFYEGAIGGMAGGTNMVPLNNNRNSLNTSGIVITSGVTYPTDNGTKVASKKVGGTGFKTTVGGAFDRSNELILKQNTTYFREFISGSDSNIISFRASWYEHENRQP